MLNRQSGKRNDNTTRKPRQRGRSKAIVIAATLLLLVASGGLLAFLHSRQQGGQGGTYDVIVVGAGPGGVAASMQAARMGAHVALFEPTDLIGGQMTAAGVGTMDEGNNNAARKSGLYAEFVQRADSFYAGKGKSDSTCYYYVHSLCIDPQVGNTILRQMLATQRNNLHVFTDTQITGILKQGGTVTGVVADGKRFNSKVVIDADEYGDVLAQAGAAFRLGNGTSSDPNPDACIQDITYTAVMKYYPNGVPRNLQFKHAPPGYSANIQKHFAGIVAGSGTDFMQTKAFPNSFASYAAWRGLPDLSNPHNYNVLQQGQPITRTLINLGNDYPLGKPLGAAFISDPSVRLQTTCDAKLLTLQMAYYIQHDLGEANWSIANDEGYDTSYNQAQQCANLKGYEAFEGQMPQEPYVREGRRLIGTQTLTAQDLAKRPWKSAAEIRHYSDSIAVGYYPTDLHGCNKASDLEASLDSASDLPTGRGPGEGPFEVPLGVLIPQKIDGLLAAEKNISTSRLANGAIREQPIAMDIGQAAGALAALAADHHTQPRNIPAREVQAALRAAHVITAVTGTATT